MQVIRAAKSNKALAQNKVEARAREAKAQSKRKNPNAEGEGSPEEPGVARAE